MSDLSLDYYAQLYQCDEHYGEEDDGLSDEEADARHRPKKMNSRKSLTPLFIYQILTKNSTPEKHISQAEIIDLLSRYPYEIRIERKAVGRALHLLADAGLGVISTTRDGAWYDECACW